MVDRAKLFKDGDGQAGRLPEGDRFMGQDEVEVSRHGRRVVLESCSPAWTAAFLELAGAAADFPYSSEVPHVEPGLDLGHRGDKMTCMAWI